MKFRFTIGRKIGAGFASLILTTLVVFILTNITLNDSQRKNDAVMNLHAPSVASLEELNLLIVRSDKLIYKWVYFQSALENPDKLALKKLIEEEYPNKKNNIMKLVSKWSEGEKEIIKQVFGSIDELFVYYEDIMMQLSTFESYEDPTVQFLVAPMVDEGGEVYVQTKVVMQKLSDAILSQERDAAIASSKMIDSFGLLKSLIIGSGFLLVIGGIIIAFFTVRTIVKPVFKLRDILFEMAKGIFPKKKIKDRDDEIGEMSSALNNLVEGMKTTTHFSHEVGEGNFDATFEPLSDEDELGHALLKMRNSLKELTTGLEDKVNERTMEVVAQKEIIEQKNKDITDSINYAKRIQDAILPPEEVVDKYLKDAFILYKPKDIVSGDFYWAEQSDGKFVYAAVDCTGHGVPGALMSMVGNNALNRTVKEFHLSKPAEILDKLNELVSETLRQEEDSDASVKDGMDISVCCIDFKNNTLEFAGAHNPLYMIRDGELTEYKANKQPIGPYIKRVPFENHKIKTKKGDVFYISSDGFPDQFGGPKGKKFMSRRFKELLIEIHENPMKKQLDILDQAFLDWRGDKKQLDDVCVIGVRI